jgi:type II secretory pathway pseudopilin PulG
MKGDKAYMSTEGRRRTPMGAADAKASNHLLIGLGVGIITTVSGLSVAGTVTAINAMNRQSEEAIAAARNAANAQTTNTNQNPPAEDVTKTIPETEPPVEENTQATTPEPTETPEEKEIQFASEQIKWMNENDITYNEYGLPEDKNGNLVDDPTTDVYDPARLAYFFNEDGTPKTPFIEDLPTEAPSDTTEPIRTPDVENLPPTETEPEDETPTTPATHPWWLDDDGNLLPGLQLDENGKPYYVVVPGDWLCRITERDGFDYHDLARESGIKDPNLIYAGDIIRFPDKDEVPFENNNGETPTGNSQAPGRG